MARTKKAEAKTEEVIVKEEMPDYGTGMTRINNMLQAGYTIEEIREAKGNE